jgi:arylsulfatase A-like enzyme
MRDSIQPPELGRAFFGATMAAFAFATLLTIRSVIHFTSTGPTIRDEVAEHFFAYSIFAVTRLGILAFLIALGCALAGMLVYAAVVAHRRSPGRMGGFIAGGAGIAVGFAYQFSHVLIFEPSTILASWAYAPWRLISIWPYLHHPSAYPVVKLVLLLVLVLAMARLTWLRMRTKGSRPALTFAASGLLALLLVSWVHWEPEPTANGALTARASGQTDRPNIVMIGNDTMRADRIGVSGNYERDLTPFIDSLARRGTYFSEAYVPQARTAPSMTSILTGAWTDTHTVTSNFVRDDQTRLDLPTLPGLLREHGYHTAAIGDWASSDVGKLDFGFDELTVSPDQWNFKYLLRQGPRDLRLYVSLFTGNKFGRMLVPELYYLAGRPLTSDKSREARRALSRLAARQDPFFLMLFVATSHGPFGSEYPYYKMFSGEEYRGESKFAMTRVSSPEEIAHRQKQGREAFDVQQLLDLYDGTIRHFDDEVRKIVQHLEKIGIADNTILVIFSDHGTDFFERGTWGQGNVVGTRDYSGHIPLLFVDPARKEGRIVPDLVRSVDIAPTLMELANIPAENPFEGVSLLPYIEGQHTSPPRAAYTESGELISRVKGLRDDQRSAPPLLGLLEIPDKRTGTIAIGAEGMKAIEDARQRLIRTDRWAAIMLPLEQGEKYFLFDLTRTDTEPEDLSASHPEVTACFRSAFEKSLALHVRLDQLPRCLGELE